MQITWILFFFLQLTEREPVTLFFHALSVTLALEAREGTE